MSEVFELTESESLANKSLYIANSSKFASRRVVHHAANQEDPHRTGQIVFMLVLFVFMVVANSSVILVTSLTRKSSRVKFFIMNLAIADLLVTLLSHLPDTIIKISISWYAEAITCRLVKYIMGVVSYASRYVLVAMTIDRLHAIVKPLSFIEGGRLSKVLIGLAWLFALLFAAPFLVLSRLSAREPVSCIVSFKILQPLFPVSANNTQVFNQQAWIVYMTSIACLVFFIPTLIIACCYSVIIGVVWKSQGKLGKLAPKGQRGNRGSGASGSRRRAERDSAGVGVGVHKVRLFSNPSASDEAPQDNSTVRRLMVVNPNRAARRRESDGSGAQRHSNSNLGVLPKAKIKSIYMTLVIVIAYVLCWTPFFLFNLLDVYRAIPQTTEKQAVSVLIQGLSHLHSAVNPIIFYVYNTDAWQVFRKLAFNNRSLRCCRAADGAHKNGVDHSGTRSSYYSNSYRVTTRLRSTRTSGGTIAMLNPVKSSRRSEALAAGDAARSSQAELQDGAAALKEDKLASFNSISPTQNSVPEVDGHTHTVDISLCNSPKSADSEKVLICSSVTTAEETLTIDRVEESESTEDDAAKRKKASQKAPASVRRTATTIYIKQNLSEHEKEVLLKYTSQVYSTSAVQC